MLVSSSQKFSLPRRFSFSSADAREIALSRTDRLRAKEIRVLADEAPEGTRFANPPDNVWYHADEYPGTDVGAAMKKYVTDNRGKLIAADARSLPFPSASFDAVFSSFLLHHLREQDQYWGTESVDRFLREIGRVLKVGGTAKITRFGQLEDHVAGLKELISESLDPNTFETRLEQRTGIVKDVASGEDMEVSIILLTVIRHQI